MSVAEQLAFFLYYNITGAYAPQNDYKLKNTILCRKVTLG